MTSTSSAAHFAQQHGLPFLAASQLPSEWPCLPQPIEYWQRHGVLPLHSTASCLHVAVASINTLRSLPTLAIAPHGHIQASWCTPETLAEGLRLLADHTHPSSHSEPMASLNNAHDHEHDVLKVLRQCIEHAYQQQASDIHIDPVPQGHILRLRIDGQLHTFEHWTCQQSERLIRQFKLLAGVDIAQSLLPQDGALHLSLNGQQHVNLRLSTLPALHGEKMVLRFIPAGHALQKLSQMGLSDTQHEQVTHALTQRIGMVLVTGPTGSGKTSTLYRLLMALKHRHQLNLCSIEDPVEASLTGVNQIQVRTAQGLTFSHILRALLRQDPDVMMVGEIRDTDTAQMAIRAAQTGHLLLTTLHTGSAAASLGRLHALGIPAYDIASAVTLIISQRLIRRLCPHCRRQERPPAALAGRYPQLTKVMIFCSGSGCAQCRGGYQGRMAIMEVVTMTKALRDALLTTTPLASASTILALNTTMTLREAALTHLLQGTTSLDEVINVLD